MQNKLTLETLTEKSFGETFEKIAKSVHNQWMEGRINAGWKFGMERDEEKKEHPSLIPYEELSEDEKEYDRQTTRIVIKSLQEIGYEIVKKQ